jgi:hypothetical protein
VVREAVDTPAERLVFAEAAFIASARRSDQLTDLWSIAAWFCVTRRRQTYAMNRPAMPGVFICNPIG